MNQKIPSSMHLRIFYPDRQLVDEDVKEVSLPGLEGLIGILPGHRPLLTLLGEGQISFQTGTKQREIQVHGGYAEIRSNSVLVFTKPAENPEERGHEG